MFEGQPYWDTRFLANLLEHDPRISFAAIYALGQRRLVVSSDQVNRVDLRHIDQHTLNYFDVVVLGKGVERLLSPDDVRLLASYVRDRGGALVLARGRPFDVRTEQGRRAMAQFESISPVSWGQGAARQLQLEMTHAGRQSDWLTLEKKRPTDVLLTRLPKMIAATRVSDVDAASIVMLRQHPSDAKTPDMAAVVHRRAGRGQVFAVLTDGLWRWALLPRDASSQVGAYEMFWRRALRWLAAGGEFLPGEDVALLLERTLVKPNEPVEVTVSTRYLQQGFEPKLTLLSPLGDSQPVALHRTGETSATWRGTVRSAQTGIHRLELSSPGRPDLIPPETPISSHLAVRSRSLEKQDVSARPETLKAIASATGGRCLKLDERDQLRDHLKALGEARQVDQEPRYDFARVKVFAIIVGAMAIEWLLRRRGGLL